MEFNATFIVTAISFVVFVLIMNAIFYKPLEKAVGERQKFVDDNYKEAAWAKEKSASLINDKAKKLEKTKHEAKGIISEKSENAKRQKSELAKEATKAASETVSCAKEELEKTKTQAQEILSGEVVALAQNISSKILGENIALENADKELIDKILKG